MRCSFKKIIIASLMLGALGSSNAQFLPATSDNQTILGMQARNGSTAVVYVNGATIATGNWLPWIDISSYVHPGTNDLTVYWGPGGFGFVDIGFAPTMGNYSQTAHTLLADRWVGNQEMTDYFFEIPPYTASVLQPQFWFGDQIFTPMWIRRGVISNPPGSPIFDNPTSSALRNPSGPMIANPGSSVLSNVPLPSFLRKR